MEHGHANALVFCIYTLEVEVHCKVKILNYGTVHISKPTGIVGLWPAQHSRRRFPQT